MIERLLRGVTVGVVVAGIAVSAAGCDYFPEYVAASEEPGGKLGIHIALCDGELVDSVSVYENATPGKPWSIDESRLVWRVEVDPSAPVRHFVAAEPLPNGMRRTVGEEQLVLGEEDFILAVTYSNHDYRNEALFRQHELRPGLINAEGENLDPSEFDAWAEDVCGYANGGGALPGWVGWLFLIGLGLVTAVTAVVTNRRYAERKRLSDAMQVETGQQDGENEV